MEEVIENYFIFVVLARVWD